MEAGKEQPQWRVAQGEPRRWRTSRVEGNPQAERVAGRLSEVAEELDLEVYYSQEQIEEIVEGATHLAANHELKEEFFEDPRKCMFLMGIAEEWKEAQKFEERKRLLDTLSVVATAFERRKTLSGKVTELTRSGRKRGTEFDPLAETNPSKAYLTRIQEGIEEDKDEDASARLESMRNDWSVRSPLHRCRAKLEITKGREQPTEFVQLKLGCLETQNKYGYPIFYVRHYKSDGTRRSKLVFNSESSQHDLEHEYMHSQSASVRSGLSRLLDCGLDEALTEHATSFPSMYPSQREVLGQLTEDVPGFERTAYRAYFSGGEEELLEMDRTLIKTYGLRGRLAVARMSADMPEALTGRAGRCVISPAETEQRLHQFRKKSDPPRGY